MDRVELRAKFAGRIEPFRLEEFDLNLHIRRLSALARARLGDKFTLLQGGDKVSSNETAVIEVQSRIVAEGLVDEHGVRIYRDDEATAIAEEFPGTALDKLSNKILEISGIGASVQENLVKNSETVQSAASPSV